MIIFRGLIIYPLITIIQIASIKLIINAFAENKSFFEIISIPIILEGFLLFLGILDSIYTEYYVNKKSLDINTKINKELFNKIIHTDYIKFDDPNFHDSYTYTAQNYTSNVNEAFYWLQNLIQAIITVIALIISVKSSDSFVLFVIFVAIFFSTLISKKLNLLNEEKKRRNIPFNRARFYADRLFALKEFAIEQKCTRLSELAYEIHDNAINEKEKLIDEYKAKTCKFNLAIGLNELFFSLSITIYLIYQVTSNKILFGDFAGLLATSKVLRQNISVFFESYTKAHSFSVYTKQIRNFFDQKPIIENNEGKSDISEEAFAVEFNNVSFFYEQSDFSIKNFNLKIKKGEKIAFVGENGAGKSTITKLLTRLYDPSKGEILINNTPLKDYKVKLIRMKIGMAFQHTHLYTMSFQKNLSLYQEINEDKLKDVSIKLGLDKILKKNNANFYSQVGREYDGRGIIMSDGETQKIGLARVLCGKFGILVLDEPTASLDPNTECELNKIIFDKAKTTTTILISHRLSNVREADRIVFIENGCIAEIGTHDELMSKNGKYCEMFTKQAQNYIK